MEEQRADMVRMRMEHELAVEALLCAFGKCATHMDAKGTVRVRKELHTLLRPLFDAKYGETPVRWEGTVQEVFYSSPKCEICGEVAEVGSKFCALCWQECPECGGRGGGGFVAEPRSEGGQNATESPCGRCR